MVAAPGCGVAARAAGRPGAGRPSPARSPAAGTGSWSPGCRRARPVRRRRRRRRARRGELVRPARTCAAWPRGSAVGAAAGLRRHRRRPPGHGVRHALGAAVRAHGPRRGGARRWTASCTTCSGTADGRPAGRPARRGRSTCGCARTGVERGARRRALSRPAGAAARPRREAQAGRRARPASANHSTVRASPSCHGTAGAQPSSSRGQGGVGPAHLRVVHRPVDVLDRRGRTGGGAPRPRRSAASSARRGCRC